MKDGKIAHQGTLQDIIDELPEVYSEYQQAVKTASESETEMEEDMHSPLSEDERKEKLRRQISREMSQESREKVLVKIWETVEKCFRPPLLVSPVKECNACFFNALSKEQLILMTFTHVRKYFRGRNFRV